jgi:kynurenine formamidase
MCVPAHADLHASACTDLRPTGVSAGPSRRRFLASAAAGAAVGIGGLTALRPAPAGAAKLSFTAAGGLVDLTHTITDTFPWYPAFSPAQRRTVYRVETNGFYAQQWEVWEHTGTHLEAPAHFLAGGRHVTDLGLDELVGLPIAVIDVAARAAQDPNTAVTVTDLAAYEKLYGRIPDGSAVLMHSAWAKRVPTPGAYQNVGTDGRLHFPGFDPEAVAWLLANRDVRGIGVDTLSLDLGRALEEFPVHVNWLGADRWGLENLANLDKVPPRGARLVAAPTPYQDGSAGQCRAFAIVA